MGAFVGNMPIGTLNVALSNFAKEFRNNAFVGDLIAPRVPVDRQSFQYVIFDRSNMRLDRQTLRAPGDRPQTDRFNYSVAPYMCQSRALEAKIPYESEAYGLGLGFSTKQKATQRLIDKINLDREVQLATLVTTAANVPNNTALAGASMWDPAAGGHPIPVVDAAKSLLRQAGLQDSEMMFVLSDPVVVALCNHPDIIDRFKYTNPGGNISLDQLSSVFRVKCVQASAISLDKTNTASWVWGVNALLCHAQPATSMQDISFAKTFTWTSAPETTEGYGVMEWPSPHRSEKADYLAVDWYWDLRITATEAAYLFTNCVAAPSMGAIPAPVEG